MGENGEVVTCEDAKVIAATLQGDPKVFVFLSVGVDNVTTCKNNPIIDDAVDDETSGL